MKKYRFLFLSILLVSFMAFAGSGFAAKGSSKQEGTSFPITLISSGNSKIMDLSGTYDYLTTTTIKKNTTGTVSLRLNMTQDERGFLSGRSKVVLSTGITTETALSGRLILTKKGTELKFNVGGGRMVKKSENSSNYTGTLVRVNGEFNGEDFDLDIKVTVNGRPYPFNGVLVPVKQDRGFSIEQTTGTIAKKSKADLQGEFPWGKRAASVSLKTKRDLTINVNSTSLKLLLKGIVDTAGTSYTITSVKAKTGYGLLPMEPSELNIETSGSLIR